MNELGLSLSHKQIEALNYLTDKTTRKLVYGGGWRGGKTFLALVFAVISCIKKKGIRILIGRMEYTNLRATTIDTLLTEVEPMMGIGSQFIWNENKHTYTCKATRSVILFRGLDPQGKENSLGGLTLTHAIIDEASELDEGIFTEIEGRLSYRLKENNIVSKLLIVSNPDRSYLYNTYFLPWEKGQLPEGTVYIQSTMADNPFLDEVYLSQMTQEHQDERTYELYIKGNWHFTFGRHDLFYPADVYDLFTSNKDGLPKGEKLISVDPAGQGKDSTVIVYSDGWFVQEIIKLQKADTPTVVARVKELKQKHNVPSGNIIVDCGGMAGHADYLPYCVRYHSNAKVIGGENYNMLRSQLIYAFADRVKKKTIRFSPSLAEFQEELIAQAVEHKAWTADMDTKQSVTPKDQVKKKLGSRYSSPDLFDAVYQLFWFALNKRKFIPSILMD